VRGCAGAAGRRIPSFVSCKKMPLVLRAISTPALHALSAGTYTSRHLTIAEGALPPVHVAVRALRLRSEGQAEPWCNAYFMVQDPQNFVVGACGFKGHPIQGRVEVGYGVSPGMRRQGHASAAVQALLAIAFSSGKVNEVLAQIAANNLASTRVAAKLGFTASGTRVDADGEVLVQWVATNAA
jgi:[ribosomal protein S5]-alanine N-acetyltransferase